MPESPSGDWRVSLVSAKGVKGPIDTVELQLEGKTNTFDVTPPTDGGAEVVSISGSGVVDGCGMPKDENDVAAAPFCGRALPCLGERNDEAASPCYTAPHGRICPHLPFFRDILHHHIHQVLNLAKTFYLYGHGNEHTTPLIITLKVMHDMCGRDYASSSHWDCLPFPSLQWKAMEISNKVFPWKLTAWGNGGWRGQSSARQG